MNQREIKFRAWTGKRIIDCEVICANEGFETWRDYEDGIGHNLLMQYTGLKDKNGKEIYEGDVVKHYGDWDFMYSEVRYSSGYWSPLVEVEDGHNCIDKYRPYCFEVVGNIYENPELLEESYE